MTDTTEPDIIPTPNTINITPEELSSLLSILTIGFDKMLQSVKRSPLLFLLCKLAPSYESFSDKDIKTIIDRLKNTDQFKDFDPVIISLREIRQTTNSEQDAINTFISLINDNLAEGTDVIIDDTNCLIKERKRILKGVTQPCYFLCIVVNKPYKECIEENKNYIDIIQEIDNNYKSFQIPFIEEGYDYIYLSDYKESLDAERYLFDRYKQSINYKIGDRTLQEQQNSVRNSVSKKSENDALIEGALYYSIGKLVNKQHYENVGAYDFISNAGMYKYLDEGTFVDVPKSLDCAFYINYQGATKTIQKTLINSVNKEKYDNLMLLDECVREEEDK